MRRWLWSGGEGRERGFCSMRLGSRSGVLAGLVAAMGGAAGLLVIVLLTPDRLEAVAGFPDAARAICSSTSGAAP